MIFKNIFIKNFVIIFLLSVYTASAEDYSGYSALGEEGRQSQPRGLEILPPSNAGVTHVQVRVGYAPPMDPNYFPPHVLAAAAYCSSLFYAQIYAATAAPRMPCFASLARLMSEFSDSVLQGLYTTEAVQRFQILRAHWENIDPRIQMQFQIWVNTLPEPNQYSIEKNCIIGVIQKYLTQAPNQNHTFTAPSTPAAKPSGFHSHVSHDLPPRTARSAFVHFNSTSVPSRSPQAHHAQRSPHYSKRPTSQAAAHSKQRASKADLNTSNASSDEGSVLAEIWRVVDKP